MGKMIALILKCLNAPHILLFHLAALDNVRNPYIGTLNKERGDIFSEFCTKSFKEKLLLYVNGVLFEMVKTSLKDTYIGGKTPIALQNEVSTCRQIYYDKDTRVMVNQLLNEFYTRFLFKIYSLPQDVVFPLDIAATIFNNLIPDMREFLISEGFHITQRTPNKTNHQVNNAENKTRTIKAEVGP